MLIDKKILNSLKIHKNDVGSSEYQIGLLTNEINNLTIHLKMHKKDLHSLRGLKQKISNRKSLLKYLKNKNIDSYKNVINILGIRK